MSVKEDLQKVGNKIEYLETNVKDLNSPSMELLRYANSRERTMASIIKCLIILTGIVFICFCISIGYLVYVLNDIEEVTTTETTTKSKIEQVSDTGNNNYIGGDNNGEVNNN